MRTHFVLCLSIFAAAGWAQTPTPTPISFTRNMTFAPVGVASSETIQVNLAFETSPTAVVISSTPPSAPVVSCSGTISFNVSGAKVQPAQVKFSVTPGEIFSTSLPWSGLGASGRPEVLASISLTQTTGTVCNVTASLETYDPSTGVTHVFQANPQNSGAIVFAQPLSALNAH
jgi:hypothetical protein